jgi:uncharacterized protein (TIRG00374 family)
MREVGLLPRRELRNKRPLIVIRLLLGLGLLALLFWHADWTVIGTLLRQVRWQLLPLLFLTLAAFISASTLQWQVLVLHPNRSFRSLAALYLVGSFFNNFLPTSFGGDVVRIYGLTQVGDSLAEALSSVVLSRVLGLVGLILTTAIAMTAYVVIGQADRTVLALGIGGSAVALIGCVAFFSLIFHPRFQTWFEALRPVLRHARLDEKTLRIHRAFAHYRNHPRLLLLSVAWAVVAQLVNSATILLLGLALGVRTLWLFYFLFVPMINLMSMLPLSLNGVGLREWSFVTLFAMAGVSKEQALSLALATWLIILLNSAIGGLIYLNGSAGGLVRSSEGD